MAVTIAETSGHVTETELKSPLSPPVTMRRNDRSHSPKYAHLDESHEPSPLAYLDLLKIYHELGRVQDYEALRADFNMVFNAGAPPFDEFAQRSRGLESYETAFSRIQALWPEPRVLDVIERSIFRDSQTDRKSVV